MWASKFFVVVLAIVVTVRAKPLQKAESFAEDTASEIKHIKEEIQQLKDHPEDASRGDKIKDLVEEVKTLKDDVIEKKKEQEIKKDVKVVKEEVHEEDSEDAVVANYKDEIQRIRTALKDPKTATNRELMAILNDEAKRIQFEVQQKIRAINEKKDETPEVIVPEKDTIAEQKTEEIVLEKEDEEPELDADEIKAKQEGEEEENAEIAAIEFKNDMKEKLVKIHDHLENIKIDLQEKKKDAQMDGQVFNDARMNDVQIKLHGIHDTLVHVRDVLAEADKPAEADAGIQPIFPKQAMPSHDTLIMIKEKLKDIKTRIEENPIKDENVKRAVAEKLHEIHDQLRDMVSGNRPEGLAMIDADDAPVVIPKESIKKEDAPKLAPKSVKQALADSMVRIKGKLLHIQKELKDTPITDKNVKKDVAAKLHIIHDKLEDVASAMTPEIAADTPEVHKNPLADELHEIKEHLLDVKAKLLKDPITDDAEKEAVKRSLERIHEKLSDFAGKYEAHAAFDEEDAPEKKEVVTVEKKDEASEEDNNDLADKVCKGRCEHLAYGCDTDTYPQGIHCTTDRFGDEVRFDVSTHCPVTCANADAPEPVRLDQTILKIKEVGAIRDELKENPSLLKDPATKKASEEDNNDLADKVCKGMCQHLAYGCDTDTYPQGIHCSTDQFGVEVRFDVSKHCPVTCANADAPEPVRLDQTIHMIKEKVFAIRDELKENPSLLKDPATKKAVEEKLTSIRTRLRDFVARSGVKVFENDTPEKKEVVTIEKVETKDEVKPLNLKLHDIRNRLVHMRDVLQSHPIKDAAVKAQVEERLHDIHAKLRDVAAHMGVDSTLNEVEKADVPEKKEIIKPKPDADAHIEKLDMKLVKLKLDHIKEMMKARKQIQPVDESPHARRENTRRLNRNRFSATDSIEKLDMKLVKLKLDHIKEMMKDHPITNDAIKIEVAEKLNHIKNDLKDYAQRTFGFVKDETTDKVEVGQAVEFEQKKDDKVKSDAKLLATIHGKLDQIRKNIIAHPLKDASAKKEVEAHLHMIKDKLADYAEARGYGISEVMQDIPAPAKEDAEEVVKIVVPELPKKEDAPAPAVNDAARYATLEERLKKIRDELLNTPIEDEHMRIAINEKLDTITNKLSDMQQKTAAEGHLSFNDQVQKAKKDELEEHLSHLKDEMAELKKEYAEVNEEKVAKDEKETEKSQSGQANDVITDWEAELDAMHD